MTLDHKKMRKAISQKAASFYDRLADDERYLAYLFLAPAVLILFCVSIFPLLYSLRTSFTDMVIGVPKVDFVGLENFRKLLVDDFFWNGLKLTAIFVSVTTIVSFVLGFIIALLLDRQFFLRSIIRTIVLSPMAITPVVVGILWLLLFMPDYSVISYLLEQVGIHPPIWLSTPGWAMATVIMAYVWEWTPFFVLMLSAGLAAIPREPMEAAMVDGATYLQSLRYIVIPFLKPIILLTVIIRMMDSFRVFDLVYVMTNGGPGRSTQVLSFVVYLNGLMHRALGYGSAMSWIMVIILIILSTLMIRSLRQVRS